MNRSISLLILLVGAVVSAAAYTPALRPDRTENASRGPSASAGGAAASVSRRDALLSAAGRAAAASAAAAGSAVLGAPASARAAETALADFEDEDLGFSMKVPSEWEASVQELPDRRKISFYFKPDSDKRTLVFLAYTPVRADFVSLGSFGSVEEVGQATILPKSELAGQGEVQSEMISSESKKQAYFFDYVTEVPGQPKTHFKTIFSLLPKIGSEAAGKVLLTITVQTPESEYASMKPAFDQVIDSYKPP